MTPCCGDPCGANGRPCRGARSFPPAPRTHSTEVARPSFPVTRAVSCTTSEMAVGRKYSTDIKVVASQISGSSPIPRPSRWYASATAVHTPWQSNSVAMIPPFSKGTVEDACCRIEVFHAYLEVKHVLSGHAGNGGAADVFDASGEVAEDHLKLDDEASGTLRPVLLIGDDDRLHGTPSPP